VLAFFPTLVSPESKCNTFGVVITTKSTSDAINTALAERPTMHQAIPAFTSRALGTAKHTPIVHARVRINQQKVA